MGRTIDADVHAAFIEFRAKENDKCLSVQCVFCNQIRAKNTSRQKQHLLECAAFKANQPQGTPSQPQLHQPNNNTLTPNGYGNQSVQQSTPTPNNVYGGPSSQLMQNGIGAPHTPVPSLPQRQNLVVQQQQQQQQSQQQQHQPQQHQQPPQPQPTPQPPQQSQIAQVTPGPVRAQSTPKPAKTPKTNTNTTNIPAPALDDVHAAFVEFKAKEEDKCMSVQCIYCHQVRAKNTSRQRQHLLECNTYLNVIKESIPANNLQHTFPEGDIARSLQLPVPALDLDFRISVQLNEKVPIGDHGPWGTRNWIGFVGGNWAGRWGKGVVLPGGQDSQLVQKDGSAYVRAHYLLQTSDEQPAYIIVKTRGWRTGARDTLEKLNDPAQADTIPATAYKFRLTISMETGDERYQHLNSAMWVGSACRRSREVIYDAYKIV